MKKFDYDTMRRKYANLVGFEVADDLFVSEKILAQKSTSVALDMASLNFKSQDVVRDWCEEYFGDNWIYSWNTFYFKFEKDATLFAMRWL
jgi:hypothetical protein